jgi:hypothetical protein
VTSVTLVTFWCGYKDWSDDWREIVIALIIPQKGEWKVQACDIALLTIASLRQALSPSDKCRPEIRAAYQIQRRSGTSWLVRVGDLHDDRADAATHFRALVLVIGVNRN